MDNHIKGQILNNYLTQQLMTTEDQDSSKQQVQSVDLPDSHNLDEFKNQVKSWIEIDNQIRKLQALIKERNSHKTTLTVKILNFMSKYNIEDLNTKDGKLRFKQSRQKRNATLKDIKTRLSEYYGSTDSVEQLAEKVFEPKFEERQYLRRLKPSN